MIKISKTLEYTEEIVEDDETYPQEDYQDGGEEEFEPDEYDLEDGITAVDLAVEYLYDQGACNASCSYWWSGLWYSTSPERDYQTGEWAQSHYHVEATEEEAKQIYQALKARVSTI